MGSDSPQRPLQNCCCFICPCISSSLWGTAAQICGIKVQVFADLNYLKLCNESSVWAYKLPPCYSGRTFCLMDVLWAVLSRTVANSHFCLLNMGYVTVLYWAGQALCSDCHPKESRITLTINLYTKNDYWLCLKWEIARELIQASTPESKQWVVDNTTAFASSPGVMALFSVFAVKADVLLRGENHHLKGWGLTLLLSW